MQTVIETSTGYMIRCKACNWHEFPKAGRPGASWTFNGDIHRPTFSPSMNELLNGEGPHHNADLPTRRCHFIVSDGEIQYCGDCTHELCGQTMPLEPWTEAQLAQHGVTAALADTADKQGEQT
jgi:hypothetical protein